MDIDEQDAAGGEEASGLIRRVRRLAKLSQRELAHELGVSQSAVAKWETARTSPSARMLTRLLDVAKLRLVAVRTNGDQVKAMKGVAARDAAGRRYPAHTYVWAEGWWVPDGAETTAWFNQIRWRSEVLELPRVRYSRRWQCGRSPTSTTSPRGMSCWPRPGREGDHPVAISCRSLSGPARARGSHAIAVSTTSVHSLAL